MLNKSWVIWPSGGFQSVCVGCLGVSSLQWLGRCPVTRVVSRVKQSGEIVVLSVTKNDGIFHLLQSHKNEVGLRATSLNA